MDDDRGGTIIQDATDRVIMLLRVRDGPGGRVVVFLPTDPAWEG